MKSTKNPFNDIANTLKRIQAAIGPISLVEQEETSDVVKYSGRYTDSSGDPIVIEFLYQHDYSLGTVTLAYQNRIVKLKVRIGGGGVSGYKIEEGDVSTLIDIVLALATDHQEM